MHCATPTKFIPRNIPQPECFKDYVGSLGISNKHHVIVYDRSPFGFYASSRAWWIFRVNTPFLIWFPNKWKNTMKNTITKRLKAGKEKLTLIIL